MEIPIKGNKNIIKETPENLSEAFKILTQMPKDFFVNEHKDDLPQEREDF